MAFRARPFRTRAYLTLGSISASITVFEFQPTMAKETNATSSPTPPPTSTLDRNSPDEAIDEKTGDVTSQDNPAAEDADDHSAKERKW